MSAPYSEDLRKKVLVLVNKKTKKTVIASQLELGRDTIYRWINLEKNTGSVAPKIPCKKGPACKIIDLDAFRNFVNANKNLTQKEMAYKYGNVSESTIARSLKKIGYSRKKRVITILKATKKIEKNSKKS